MTHALVQVYTKAHRQIKRATWQLTMTMIQWIITKTSNFKYRLGTVAEDFTHKDRATKQNHKLEISLLDNLQWSNLKLNNRS